MFVNLAGLIDVPAEIARNQRERSQLQQLIAGKEKKLSNDNFLSRAPADVVQKERAALEELREKLATVEAHLAQLHRLSAAGRNG